MKIHMGTDHAGFALKEKLKTYLETLGYEVVDHGAFSMNPTDDYPNFITPTAKAVSENAEDKGIILGMSGEGEQMDANRFPHIRAAEFYGGSLEIIKLARTDNDANILSLGAKFVTEDEAKQAVKLFLETPFSNEERHERRIAEMN